MIPALSSGETRREASEWMPGWPIERFKSTSRRVTVDATRIVAHDAFYESGRYYDMLRTLVLQTMDENGWQILAITSPTAGCGKSVTRATGWFDRFLHRKG